MTADNTKRATHLNNEQKNEERENEYLRLTLAMLGRLQLSPDPDNFALIHEYVLGSNSKLMAEIDTELTRNGTLPDEVAKTLYRRFIWDADRQKVELALQQMRRLVGETLLTIHHAENEAGQQADVIASHSQRLNEALSAQEIKQIISAVVSDTRLMVKNTYELKYMLQDTRNEVEKLRSELEIARQEAVTDTLTGLSNRRAFETAIAKLSDQSRQHHTDLSLMIIDIDFFKNINDEHGHLVGDKVLRSLANLLSANVKGKDIVARIGGEEFAILLTDTQLENAKKVAETLRRLVEQTNFKRIDTGRSLGRLTISIGITNYRAGEFYEGFWGRADQALYQAKQSGRNQVVAQPDA